MTLKDLVYEYFRTLKTTVHYRGITIPTGNPPISRKIFKQLAMGRYEVPELTAIEGLLRRGDRVLELGSGLGIVSALTSRMQPDIEIWTFEANPDLVDFITEVHRQNTIRNVRLRNAVLMPAPSASTVDFYIHRSFAESSLVPHNAVVRVAQIPCEDLNFVLRDFQPDLLVCDIEGGEERIFDGLDLTGLRGLVIELHPTVISRQSVKRIYDACAAASLYPRVELCSGTVVAFESVEAGG